MYIDSLKINNFRLFENKKIDFTKDINILYGLNGQGKTSIIEAVY